MFTAKAHQNRKAGGLKVILMIKRPTAVVKKLLTIFFQYFNDFLTQ